MISLMLKELLDESYYYVVMDLLATYLKFHVSQGRS
jgi:hypothetical protein